MVAVAVLRPQFPGWPTPPGIPDPLVVPPPAPRRHPKMKIVPQGGDPFVVPYAPRGSQTDALVPTWATVDRGGQTPLLLRSGRQLPTMSFDLIFGHPDHRRSIEKELGQLRKLAKSGKLMRVKLDTTSAAYRWRLTGFQQTIVSRQQGTNEPTRAVCAVTFTVASDSVVQVGPVSGGSKGDKKDDLPKFYVVKKGDTLQSIAKRFYGKASAWRHIADFNKIRDPKKVKVGTKLRLPRYGAEQVDL